MFKGLFWLLFSVSINVDKQLEWTYFLFSIVGPCALEFTRVKTSDHMWTDPHADELVQRHRMHSNNRTAVHPIATININNSFKYRPGLQINVRKKNWIIRCVNCFFQSKRHGSSSGEDAQKHSQLISINPARDYVESLHQNAKSQLIYGKNNVFVQPVRGILKKIIILMVHLDSWSWSHTWLFIIASLSAWFNTKMDTKSIDEWL